MGQFRCQKCGWSFQSQDMLGQCPNIQCVWGIPKKNCICGYYTTLAGRTGIVAKWNPECVVHIEDPTKQKIPIQQ